MFEKIMKAGLVLTAVWGWLYIYACGRVPDVIYFPQGQEISIQSVPIVTLGKGSAPVAEGNDSGLHTYTVRLLGLFPVKEVAVIETQQRYVNVSGKPFGIKMFCDGVMVVGFSDILTEDGYHNPAKIAGLKAGDVITHINGQGVQTNEDVEKTIQKSGGGVIKINFLRDDRQYTASLTAVADKNSGQLRTGMWVRDSGAGIGTMTFYDTQTGYFAGLGHGIKDVDTQKELKLLSGEIVPVKITGIVKSRNGSAGQLKGRFVTTIASGRLLYNGGAGVYGQAYTMDRDNIMPVASRRSIKPGPAYILTTINGSQPQMYSVEIEKVNLTADDNNKNMVIKVTDSRLLTLTGGIVAGMSGSPIVQNGQLAGAVTHVFVNNVERGYGIFAENMLSTLDKVAKAESNMAA